MIILIVIFIWWCYVSTKREEAVAAREVQEGAVDERVLLKLRQAEADIRHWNDTANKLYALLDVELLEQSGALPGSKTDLKCQKKIITLNNQIHDAEARLSKAKYNKAMAMKEIAA